MDEAVISVEVVHADARNTWRRRISVPAGSTAMQAVEASGLLPQLPFEALSPLRLGVHSRRVGADHVLRDGDRVELYRPLALDPMAARRRRAGK